MSLPRDPYDKRRVLDALAEHAWSDKNSDHKIAFQKLGLQTKEQLRDAIEQSIEGSDTRVFKTQPVKEKGQTFPREVYELPLRSAEGKQPVAILNPGLDRNGRLAGGTCYVPGENGKTFDEVFDREQMIHDQLNTGHTLQVMQGGRPALREQERHQQVSTDVKTTDSVEQRTLEPEPAQPSLEEASSPDNSSSFEDSPPLTTGELDAVNDMGEQRGAEMQHDMGFERGG